jgi:hypothetical protein
MGSKRADLSDPVKSRCILFPRMQSKGCILPVVQYCTRRHAVVCCFHGVTIVARLAR